MEEFAKTIHSFQYGPHDMRGGTARLFDTAKDGRYANIFGDGESVWVNVPEADFRRLAGEWFVCEFVRGLWKEERDRRAEEELAELALERRYLVYFAVAELLRMVYKNTGRDLREDLRKLGSPRWTERDGQEKKALREITKLAFTGLIKAYTTASTESDFRHRNWFRERAYLEKIRSELGFITEIRTSVSQALPILIAD